MTLYCFFSSHDIKFLDRNYLLIFDSYSPGGNDPNSDPVLMNREGRTYSDIRLLSDPPISKGLYRESHPIWIKMNLHGGDNFKTGSGL